MKSLSKIILIFGILLFLAGVVTVVALPELRFQRALYAAQKHYERGEIFKSLRWLHLAQNYSPDRPATLDLLTVNYDRIGLPAAAHWTFRHYTLNPDNLSLWSVSLEITMRYGRMDLAQLLVQQGSERFSGELKFLQGQAYFYLTRQDIVSFLATIDSAHVHPAFKETDEWTMLTAVAGILSDQPELQQKSFQTVHHLYQKDPTNRFPLLFKLLTASERHAEASSLATHHLQLLPESNFQNALFMLEAWLRYPPAESFTDWQKKMELYALTHPAALSMLGKLYEQFSMNLKWFDLIEQAKPAVRDHPAVLLVTASMLVQAEQWQTLLELFENQESTAAMFEQLGMNAFPELLVLLAEEKHSGSRFPKRWSALLSQQNNPVTFITLANLANRFNWTERQVQALDSLAARFPLYSRYALERIHHIRWQHRDTVRLLLSSRKLYQADPSQPEYLNNVLYLEFLTKTPQPNALKKARTLVKENPGNIHLRSTLALGLYQNGQAREAYDILVTSREPIQSQRILYLLSIYAHAAGMHSVPVPDMDSLQLLPEERELMP